MTDETFPQPSLDAWENPQSSSIKIMKNTKGYNFEFKILSVDVEEMDKIHNAIVEKIRKWEGGQ